MSLWDLRGLWNDVLGGLNNTLDERDFCIDVFLPESSITGLTKTQVYAISLSLRLCTCDDSRFDAITEVPSVPFND